MVAITYYNLIKCKDELRENQVKNRINSKSKEIKHQASDSLTVHINLSLSNIIVEEQDGVLRQRQIFL